MPYITEAARARINAGEQPENSGQLTYKFYKAGLEYVGHKGTSFQAYCDVVGALFCTALELYRTQVAPYEDIKKEQNGDVT